MAVERKFSFWSLFGRKEEKKADDTLVEKHVDASPMPHRVSNEDILGDSWLLDDDDSGKDGHGYILTIINDKGGVGKTTTAVSLAAALATRGRVLLVDLDRQGSATIALGYKPEQDAYSTIAGVFEAGFPIETVIKETLIENLDIIPSGIGMTFLENKLQHRFEAMKTVLNPLRDQYQYILLDCSPTFTSLSCNAVMASDRCIVPVSLDHLSVSGIESLVKTLQYFNLIPPQNIPILGIILTMVDHQLPDTGERINDLRQKYGNMVFDTTIHYDKRLAEAPAQGKTIFDYAGGSRGARCYWALSKEVARRCRSIKRLESVA